MIINKYNKYKKQYEKDQQTIYFLDNLYRKRLQGKVFARNENESLCNSFTKYFDETKIESFLININIKIGVIFLVIISSDST